MAKSQFQAQSPFEKATKNTRLGSIVSYYENGDPAQEPLMALVTRVTPTGLMLCVFTYSGPRQREYTRHIADPWFVELEGREKTLREKGAWDTLDNAHDRLDEQAQVRREAVSRRQAADEQNRQAIIDEEPLLEEHAMAAEQMAREGVDLPTMVAKLGGRVTVGQLKSHFDLNPVSA